MVHLFAYNDIRQVFDGLFLIRTELICIRGLLYSRQVAWDLEQLTPPPPCSHAGHIQHGGGSDVVTTLTEGAWATKAGKEGF